MKNNIFTERGQVLIMIALAIVGLVGFTALAIDGGNVFSDRRHSQNASDTAVLTAALEQVRRPNGTWQDIARQRAAENGYDDADPVTEVDVYRCDDLPLTVNGYTLECKALPQGASPEQYVFVHIKSVVKLFFAPVIGWSEVTNHTDAVARSVPPEPTNIFDGYGIVALHEGCRTPGDGDPFELGGSAESEVHGAGVLVNASCPTDDSFVQNGNPELHTTTGVCVHGTADYDPSEITADVSPSLEQGCEPIDPDTYQDPPAPDCETAGLLQNKGTYWIAYPGYYDSVFPDVNGQATIKMMKGVYCLNEGMNLNAGLTLTTDMDNSGDFDTATEGVLIYLPGTDNGDEITFNGGATINIHAITVPPFSTFDPSWINLLIYVNPDYDPDIDISGNSGSSFTGTIYAPGAHVHLLGNNGTNAGTVYLDSQIIADTVKISGNTTFELHYDDSNNITTLTNPNILMIE